MNRYIKAFALLMSATFMLTSFAACSKSDSDSESFFESIFGKSGEETTVVTETKEDSDDRDDNENLTSTPTSSEGNTTTPTNSPSPTASPTPSPTPVDLSGGYGASMNVTDRFYSAVGSVNASGSMSAYFNLSMSETGFSLSCDTSRTMGSINGFVDSNFESIVLSYLGMSREEAEQRSIEHGYESYDAMLADVRSQAYGQVQAAASGYVYYGTSGSYTVDGNTVVFNSDQGTFYGTYNGGSISVSFPCNGETLSLTFG